MDLSLCSALLWYAPINRAQQTAALASREGRIMTTTTTTMSVKRPAALDLLSAPEDRSEADLLASLIPSPLFAPQVDDQGAWVAGYAERSVDGALDLDVLAAAIDLRINVLLEGPTGSGKTLVGRAFAAAHGLPYYALPINGGIDPSTVWGRYILSDPGQQGAVIAEYRRLFVSEGQAAADAFADSLSDAATSDARMVWVWSPAALIVMHGGVLVLDELNMAHPRVLAMFHELTDLRRSVTVAERGGIVLKAHPALLIVATLNPGYQGTATLNEALRRRFGWPITWDYDAGVESRLIPSEALLDVARQIRETPEVRTDLSTDLLVTFVDTASVMGLAFAIGRMVAAFQPAERGGVARYLELRAPAIASDLGIDSE